MFWRLDSVYPQLLAELSEHLPPETEGMSRVIKCFQGNQRLDESLIVGMLPEMVTILCTEECMSDSEEGNLVCLGFCELFFFFFKYMLALFQGSLRDSLFAVLFFVGFIRGNTDYSGYDSPYGWQEQDYYEYEGSDYDYVPTEDEYW